MLRKSPASDVWAAVLKNAWELYKNYKTVYFSIFFFLRLFFVFIINGSTILLVLNLTN